MRTKPAVCFLALGCELRYNTADRARARGLGLRLRLGLGLGVGRMPLCTQSTTRVSCAYKRDSF